MSERDEQIQRDVSVDTEFGGGDDDLGGNSSLADDFRSGESTVGGRESGAREDSSQESGGLARSLYDRSVGKVLSARSLGIAIVTTLVSVFAFGLIPLLGTVGELLGIFAAALVYGLATDERRYLELVLAGALVGGGSALLGNLLISIFGTVMPALAITAVSALAAAVGHYVGRDTRKGFTRDLE